MQESKLWPRTGAGPSKQTGPAERVGRDEDRVAARPERTWHGCSVAHPAHLCHHRRGPGRGDREVARANIATTKTDEKWPRQTWNGQTECSIIEGFPKSAKVSQSPLLNFLLRPELSYMNGTSDENLKKCDISYSLFFFLRHKTTKRLQQKMKDI